MSGAGSLLLAFDFDGALAPLQDDPASARIDRAATALLQRAAHMPRVTVAIVSGRDADDLAARIDAPWAYIVASHGLEIRAPGGVVVRDAPLMTAAPPPELAAELGASGLRVERKKHAIAIHWRGIPVAAVEPVIDQFRAWAQASELDLVDGSCVLEARCRGGSKTDALRWVMRAAGTTRLIYAAHDGTEVAALRFAAQQGRAVSVAPHEGLRLPGVTEVGSIRQLFRLVREEAMM